MKAHKDSGMALLAVLAVIALGSLLASQTLQSQRARLITEHAASSSDRASLQIAKRHLLHYAGMQGQNSLYDLGNLPCPSLQADGIPQTTCHQTNVGFLPRQSKSAINHLRLAISNQGLAGLGKPKGGWHYAVSTQLTQANSLGWSGKVDWSKPPLEIELNGKLHESVVAVVSAHLETLPKGILRADNPTIFITEKELRSHTDQVILASLNATLGLIGPETAEPLLFPLLDADRPQPAACNCRCTKTLCACQCTNPAWWGSES